VTRGWGGIHATTEEERMDTIEERIERLLDQLENPHLKPYEVEAIEGKVQFLRSLQPA
jgi:hypothetical protein